MCNEKQALEQLHDALQCCISLQAPCIPHDARSQIWHEREEGTLCAKQAMATAVQLDARSRESGCSIVRWYICSRLAPNIVISGGGKNCDLAPSRESGCSMVRWYICSRPTSAKENSLGPRYCSSTYMI